MLVFEQYLVIMSMFRLSGFWSSNRKRSQSANGKFDREKGVKNEGDGEDQARDLPENETIGKPQKSHPNVLANSDELRDNNFASRSRSGSHPGVASSASPSTTRHSTASSSTSNSNIGVGERKISGLSKLSASSLALSTAGITTSTLTPTSAGRTSRLSEEIEEEIYPKPTASELRVAQYEKPLTKGHCPKRKSKPQGDEGNEKKPDEKTKTEKLAQRRSEKRERYINKVQRF